MTAKKTAFNDPKIGPGTKVYPKEGSTWNNAHEGTILDLYIDEGEELAEVRWNDNAMGTWPTKELMIEA